MSQVNQQHTATRRGLPRCLIHPWHPHSRWRSGAADREACHRAARARRRIHLRGSLPGSIRSMRIYRIACPDESVPGVRRGARRGQAPGLADRDPADACRGM